MTGVTVERVWQIIRRGRGKWIRNSDILKRSHLLAKELETVRSTLVEMGRVEVRKVKAGNGKEPVEWRAVGVE